MTASRLVAWARAVEQDVIALWIAARSPRTPWIARALAAGVAAYALSPIDLIPDFIPVIGYLDDVVLVPLGIALAVRLIPATLMLEFRGSAAQAGGRFVSRTAAAFVVASWVVGILTIVGWWLRRP